MGYINAWFKNSPYNLPSNLEIAKTEVLSSFISIQKGIFINRLKGDLGSYYENMIDENGRIGANLALSIGEIFSTMQTEYATGGRVLSGSNDISYRAGAKRVREYIEKTGNVTDIIAQTKQLLINMIEQIRGAFNTIRGQQIIEAAKKHKPIVYNDVKDGILNIQGIEATITQVIGDYNKILEQVNVLESLSGKVAKGNQTTTFRGKKGTKLSVAEQKTIGGLLSDVGGIAEEVAEIVALREARTKALKGVHEIMSTGRSSDIKITEDAKIKEDMQKENVPPINKNDITISVGEDKVIATVGLSVKVSEGYTNLKNHTIKIQDSSLTSIFEKAAGKMQKYTGSPFLDYAKNLAAGLPDDVKRPTKKAFSQSQNDYTKEWNQLKNIAATLNIVDYLTGIGGANNNSIILIYNRQPILMQDILSELVKNPYAINVGGPTKKELTEGALSKWDKEDPSGQNRSNAVNSYLDSQFGKTASIKINLASLKGLNLT